MHTLAAGSWIFAALLAFAGFAKVVSPAATGAALQGARLPSSSNLVRLLGIGEVMLAAAVLLLGGWAPAAALAIAYVGFAAFAWRQSRNGEDCGCFGKTPAPATSLHVGINVAGAAVSSIAVAWPVGSPLAEPGGLEKVLGVGLVVLGALLLRLALTALPELAVATRLLQSDA